MFSGVLEVLVLISWFSYAFSSSPARRELPGWTLNPFYEGFPFFGTGTQNWDAKQGRKVVINVLKRAFQRLSRGR